MKRRREIIQIENQSSKCTYVVGKSERVESWEFSVLLTKRSRPLYGKRGIENNRRIARHDLKSRHGPRGTNERTNETFAPMSSAASNNSPSLILSTHKLPGITVIPRSSLVASFPSPPAIHRRFPGNNRFIIGIASSVQPNYS